MTDNIIKNEENVPFDIHRDSSVKYPATRVVCQQDGSSSVPNSVERQHVPPSSFDGAADTSNVLNEYNEDDDDDEEDFIKIYFASGTVLKPSDEPYNLRSKIDQANQELANDSDGKTVANVPGRVTFDDTVVVLDSFEDIGTVSIGTERLQGAADPLVDRNDRTEEDAILATVDLSRNGDRDDQNDVVCSAVVGRTARDTDATDEKTYSSASFSRSFSSESDDPLFVNVIESGDEFKMIMNRNAKAHQGSVIDEHVTYFPELFTHAQYKIYENPGRPSDGGHADDVNIYVPRKLDADELRNKLKEISRERKRVVINRGGDDVKKAENKSAKKVGGGLSAMRNAVQNKMKQPKTSDKNRTARLPPAPPARRLGGKPRVTYYFELDPKGKLKPLNKNNVNETRSDDKSSNAKFFHINLKATKNDENAKPRITKTPNADLFLEFQTDKSGNKGAKLVIKKKPTEDLYAVTCGAAAAKKSVGTDRPKLPGYNGLRSEYGLSAEQLLERRRMKMEREKRRKEFRQKKYEEEQQKRAENEKNFYKWLQQKKQTKKQSKTRHSYPMNRLTVSSARNSVNFVHAGDQRKGSFALEELLKIKDENNGWFKF